MRFSILTACALAALMLATASLRADAPFIPPAEDAEHFGDPDDVLVWSVEEKIAGFRNADRLYDTRTIRSRHDAAPLQRALVDLGDVEVQVGDESMTVDEFFERMNVAGLLVIKDGRIVYERYGLGNTARSRWVSFSVAKSVVSLLFGAAIKDGYISGVEDKITDYLPRLKGSSYEDATIRNILQMASGVEWNEDYSDPDSDVSTATWDTLSLLEQLGAKPRRAAAGELFNYNTAETNLAGILLRSAIGNNLSTYLSEKIWKPFGMESDATWNLTEPGGGEFGGCCINATLRDYGRLGLFALANGRLPDGTEVLPADWMKESTQPSRAYPGYGYFWWLGDDDRFGASGIFGQGIHIDRGADVVIAIQSAREHASRDEDWAWQTALYRALTHAVSD